MTVDNEKATIDDAGRRFYRQDCFLSGFFRYFPNAFPHRVERQILRRYPCTLFNPIAQTKRYLCFMENLAEIAEFKTSPELLALLYQYSIVKNAAAGKVILNGYAPIRSIPIVIKGTLKVMRTEEDDREFLLYYSHICLPQTAKK